MHLDAWNCVQQFSAGASQFTLVMRGFRLSAAAEASGKPSISAAIGVHHQDYSLGAMQRHRLSNLVQHKFAIRLTLRRSEALGAARHSDGIGIRHPDALQEFAEGQIKSIIEAPKDGRIALIALARRIKMKNLLQDAPPDFRGNSSFLVFELRPSQSAISMLQSIRIGNIGRAAGHIQDS